MNLLNQLNADLRTSSILEDASQQPEDSSSSEDMDGVVSSLRDDLRRCKREIKLLRNENEGLVAEIGRLQDTMTRQVKTSDEIAAMRKPFVQPPPEILHMIFLRVIPPPFLLDPAISAGPQSTWCKVLRQKKSLVLVCRMWNKIALQFLYEDVCFRRFHQLGAFLRTIENSPGSLGFCVKKITIYSMVPKNYSGLFKVHLQRIFDRCPRLSHFAYTSPCPLPALNMLSMSKTITHLAFSDSLQFMTILNILTNVSGSLLSLSLPMPVSTLDHWDAPLFTFPRLESLFCVVAPYTRKYLGRIARKWTMPALRHLTFKFSGNPINWEPAVLITDFTLFCSIHGKGLKFLHIHPEYWWSMAQYYIHTQALLDACPALEHLLLHPKSAMPLSHANVQWIDIWAPHVRSACANDWTKLRQSLTTQSFPKLKGVRTLSATFSSLQDLPAAIPPDIVTSKAEKFECNFLDMHFRHDHGNIYNMDPEWTEDDADDGGLYYLDEDSSDSDYGSSDSSYESSSEGEVVEDDHIEPDWDAEPDIIPDVPPTSGI